MLRAIFRTYHEPMPSDRDVLDAVSNICSSIKRSLKKGTVSNCTFTINMRRDILTILFNGKGTVCNHKPGRFYNLIDFDSTYLLYIKLFSVLQ